MIPYRNDNLKRKIIYLIFFIIINEDLTPSEKIAAQKS